MDILSELVAAMMGSLVGRRLSCFINIDLIRFNMKGIFALVHEVARSRPGFSNRSQESPNPSEVMPGECAREDYKPQPIWSIVAMCACTLLGIFGISAGGVGAYALQNILVAGHIFAIVILILLIAIIVQRYDE